MTLNFVIPEFNINGAGTPPLQFFRRGFNIGTSGSTPSWQDIILSGNGSLTLTNAKADGLNYLKLFGGTVQSNLPKGYTQYEYLRSSGTQYIDLGYKGKGNTKVEIKFKYYQTSSVTGSGRVFGSRTTSSTDAFAIGTSSGIVASTGNKVFWCYDGQSFYVVEDAPFGLDEWQTVVFSATEHKVNGTTEGDDYTVTTFETPSNLKLFAFDNNGTIGCGYVDIAYCKLWDDDGTLVRDVVPAYDGTAYGMYDKVSGAMLPNAGTGDFAVGSVVSSPTPDTPMDIISNNGVLTFGTGNTYNTADGQGTFVTPSQTVTTRIYKAFGQLKAGKYKVKITGDFEFIFQYKDTNDLTPTNYGNIGTWATEGVYEITDASLYYGVAIRNGSGSGSIYPSNFNNIGSIGYSYLDVVPVGTVETVGVYGNNIFNKNDTANIGNWYVGTSQTIMVANANETIVMRAKPSTTYYFKHCSVKGGCRAFYTEVEDWEIGSACSAMSGNAGANANTVYSITTSANAKWIFFNCGRNNVEASFDDQRNDFMVSTSELTSDTPYEPYYNGGSATAEMLLKVGTYQDEQSVLDGGVTREVGIKVLNGTESWTRYGAGRFATPLIGSKKQDLQQAPISSHFVGVSNNNVPYTDGRIAVFNGSIAPTSGTLGVSYQATPEVADFKQWLTDQYNAGVPVIIVYALEESTTETVTPQPLTIQAGTNVVAITQASMDNLELEVSYKAGVEVTVTEIENAQLDNSVEVIING